MRVSKELEELKQLLKNKKKSYLAKVETTNEDLDTIKRDLIIMNSSHLSKLKKNELIEAKSQSKAIYSHRSTIQSKEIAEIVKLFEKQSRSKVSFGPIK